MSCTYRHLARRIAPIIGIRPDRLLMMVEYTGSEHHPPPPPPHVRCQPRPPYDDRRMRIAALLRVCLVNAEQLLLPWVAPELTDTLCTVIIGHAPPAHPVVQLAATLWN